MEITKPEIKFDAGEELFRKYIRVLKLARTPSRDEYQKIAMVVVAGVAIIGMIGFIIFKVMILLPS